MSHFTVLVIGPDPEKQLAPFQENNMSDCPKEYLAFNDTEDEFRKEYETDGCEMIRCADGSLVYSWDERFRVKGAIGFGGESHRVPDDCAEYRRVHVPHKERFATFEAYVADYHSVKERDPEKGRFGYWENPNRKWDWYQLGGRWTGFFQLKPGARGDTGEAGLMTAPAKPGEADQALKRDIDWEGMQARELAEALPRFEQVIKIVAGRDVPRWEEVRAAHGEDIEAARLAYNGHPVIQDLRKAHLDPVMKELRDVYCDFDRERFIQKTIDSACLTFAVLKDGKWFERGEMGWWGVVHDEKETKAWESEFAKLIAGLPNDTLLSVYDCHI